MESFFAKKGLTLSRNANAKSQINREQLLRTQQQNNQAMLHLIPKEDKLSLQKNLTTQNANRLPNKSQNGYHSLSTNREEKQFNIGPNIRLMTHKEVIQTHPPLPKKKQWKQVSTFNPNLKNQLNQYSFRQSKQLNNLSINQNVSNRSFEENYSLVERQSAGQSTANKSHVKSVSQFKVTLEAHRAEAQTATKIKKNSEFLENSPVRSKGSSQAQRKINMHPEQQLDSKILNQRLNLMQREKDELLFQLRNREGKFVPQEWIQQKHTLLSEIKEKTVIIREIQSKSANDQQQLKAKISNLQFEIRVLQGNKNRIENQNENNKKLIRTQLDKNLRAKQEIKKLIFFDEDLIHSKDYDNLKKQIEQILTENAKMFQQHQQYILQVSENRRKLSDRLQEVEQELSKLKKQYNLHHCKMERLTENGDDKIQIIKLQNQINFLKKKNEQSMETIISKQRQLEEVKLAIQKITARQNQKNENNQKVMEEISLWQIKQTIAAYQTRISDFNQVLAFKNTEIEQQKKLIEFLTEEVRNYKEDKHINTIKEKSSENNLKNEVETLQRTLQMEIDIKNKKISNLQESMQRKFKQIDEKDKFIKSFLISRMKQLDSNSADQILGELKSYFQEGQS